MSEEKYITVERFPQLKQLAPEDFKLTGYIAGDTFKSRGHSHFATMDGEVVCGTKNRFGMDCAAEIRIADFDHFETDTQVKFGREDKMNLRKNHLPMDCFITCKKCQKKIKQMLEENLKQE